MDKIINNFEIGLFFWQALLVALLLGTGYFLFKLYKKINEIII